MTNLIPISGSEVLSRLTDLGVQDFHGPRDATYVMPSDEWLENKFGPFLKHEFWAYSRKYIREKFDCDDFANESDIEADLDLLADQVMSTYRSLRARMAVKAAVRSLVENTEITNAGVTFFYAEVTLPSGFTLNDVAGPGRHATNLVLTPSRAIFFEPQNSFITDAKTVLGVTSGFTADWVWL